MTLDPKPPTSAHSVSDSEDAAAPLVLTGELTIYTAAGVFARLRSELPLAGDCLLDLAEITEMDSAGLQILFWAKRELEQRGARLLVSRMSRPVADVLSLLQLRGLFGAGSATQAEAIQ